MADPLSDIGFQSGIIALLQTTVMMVSVPFGYLWGLLSDISRVLPFVLSIALLLLGILAIALFYRGQNKKREAVVSLPLIE